MIRKIGIAFLALLSVFFSSSWTFGFYLDGGIGPEIINFKQDARIIRTNNNIKDTTPFSGQGLFGSIVGGYSWG